jgi:hypothetical protein
MGEGVVQQRCHRYYSGIKGPERAEDVVKRSLIIVAFCLVIVACSGNPDTSENVLPDWVSSEKTDVADDVGISDAAGRGEVVYPATFRFEEINIDQLGTQGPTDILTQILSIQWKADIDQYKLNILFTINALDEQSGSISLVVNSGIGGTDEELCVETTSKTEGVDGEYVSGDFTYFFDVVNIYSEDNDGTHFNCSLEESRPNAIPLRSCDGTGELSADGKTVAGVLICCMAKFDVDTTCSCLGSCNPEQVHEDCGGCPNGSAPLNQKLGDIATTPICTERIGEPAYDLHVTFSAERIEFTPSDCE